MPRVGFEPTISAGERPKIYALDRTATGTGTWDNVALNYREINECASGKIGMEASVSRFGILPQYLSGRNERKQRLDQSLHYVTVSRFEASNI